MQPNPEFTNLPKSFWANIKTISQRVGYTQRASRKKSNDPTPSGEIKVPTVEDVLLSFTSLNLSCDHLFKDATNITSLGAKVFDYFRYRADVLNRVVRPLLMNAEEARKAYELVHRETQSQLVPPSNKQSGAFKNPAYFTAIINMLIEKQLGGLPCDYNPQQLTTVTRERAPFRTLSRRVDGAFPGPVNPIAVWEIKEYYYTTTFGSRVADGVYETLLDGFELEELNAAMRAESAGDQNRIQHLLMVDAYFTWWIKGRSYLCRIIDMLHMGYVDEVLFGREVIQRLPMIAKEWKKSYRQRRF